MISYRAILVAALVCVALILLLALGTGRTAWLGGALSSVLVTLFLLYCATVYEAVRRTPVPSTIALLGYPNAGKTTYLAVLFELMQREDTGDIALVPSGQRTFEWAGSAMNVLSKGKLLPKTYPGQLYILRAEAIVRRRRRRLAVEIADAAGEHTYRLAEGADRWLHDDEFFKWSLRADAFMLAIDVKMLLELKSTQVFEQETGLIVALQVLVESKAAGAIRMREPVAVLLMKDDLICCDQHDDALKRIARLRDVLQKRCERVEYFFVSSLRVHENHVELAPPINVLEPVLWVLANTRHGRSAKSEHPDVARVQNVG